MYEYQVEIFHTAGELVMLPLSVGYLMPRKGEATLAPCGGITVLLASLAFHFHETFKEVAFLRVFSCLNFTITVRFLIKEGEWIQAKTNSIMSCTCSLQRAGKKHPILVVLHPTHNLAQFRFASCEAAKSAGCLSLRLFCEET